MIGRVSESRHTAGAWSSATAVVSVVAVALAAAAGPPIQALTEAGADPLAALWSELQLGDSDRRELRQGKTVVRTLDADHPSHIGVVAVARIDVGPKQFVERVRDAERLWRGPGVPATGRVGDPPQLRDFSQISLSRDELDALRHCQPGDCDVKLSAQQMAQIRAAIERHPGGWRAAAADAFRATLLEALATYRREGLYGLPQIHDHESPIERQAVFARLLASARNARAYAPRLAEYLERYPRSALPEGAEQHIHWMQTVLLPKPTLQVWHATIRQQPATELAEVVVLSRQVLATHYINGSLALTLLSRATPDRYLIHINWTATDGLDGFLSGLRRYFVERRVRASAREAFETFKRRIEATTP